MLQSDWIHFMFLNWTFCRIDSAFRCIGSAFRMTGMGVADWVELKLPKTALAVASCSFSAKTNGYDWRWTARESFLVLSSNETVGMVWHSFDTTTSVPNYCQACWSKKLALGHIINTLLHFLGQAVQKNIQFLASGIGPPQGRANTATLESNILLYCPLTCAIIYMYFKLNVVARFWSKLDKSRAGIQPC